MKKSVTLLLACLFCVTALSLRAQLPQLPVENINVIVLSDMGVTADRQENARGVAAQVTELVKKNRMDFVIVAGDPIHDRGVQSVDDPEWQIKVENLYSDPALHTLPWYVISGNHEYNGNVNAVLAYSNVSPRWNAPARYYAFERSLGYGNAPCLFTFLDTTPMMGNYAQGRSDAETQNPDRQVKWLDSTLVASRAGWKIVIGHHPLYSYTEKSESQRETMQQRLGPILEGDGADFYICGHIHSFQYLRPAGTRVNYVVNPSGHTARPVEATEGTVAFNSAPGFTLYSISKEAIDFYSIDYQGKIVYQTKVKK